MSHAGCPFCEIAATTMPAADRIGYTHCVQFTPLNPATKGHTLVVPRVHAEGVWDIPHEPWLGTMRIVRHVAGELRRQFKPDGMNIIQSTGAAATMTIPHLHVHVVPRYHGDAMGPIWPAPAEA